MNGKADPLAAFQEDHRRILRHCRGLRSLMLFIGGARPDRDALMLGHFLLRFFDVQVPLHCSEEEEVLFPALLGSMAGPDAARIRDLARRSRLHHHDLSALWSALRPALETIAAGRRALLDRDQVATFSREWANQVRFEEAGLLALAERVLTPDEADHIRRQIRDRRW